MYKLSDTVWPRKGDVFTEDTGVGNNRHYGNTHYGITFLPILVHDTGTMVPFGRIETAASRTFLHMGQMNLSWGLLQFWAMRVW